ncbi:hypothetical protein SCP_1303190 [Sparassis crispa]|uniref:AB hydrolase-1 domain-containing protein n=1 Tax=Sparassis crispa TaxID=139825 RepID=A0A401H285_9APHY|nr:hypothetical protein SCP_1303190 [Sparassis crispa]GBE88503.1 hypothetical protein SCP_1303190 [Sparassis crispa]
MQALGLDAGLRIVAINRGYAPSTPFAPADLAVLPTGGTEEVKEAFLTARGIEIANFIDAFIQKYDIPPISEDGKKGGVGLLGWSAGNTVTLSAIANFDKLPSEVQSRLARYLRALIMDGEKSLFHRSWLTAYFNHGDLSKRDPKLLSLAAPSLFRRPTIYSMTAEDITELIDDSVFEGPNLFLLMPQHLAAFRKARFDRATRAVVPKMGVWAVVGDSTLSTCILAWWTMQDEDAGNGGGFINFKMTEGVNHLIHWDDPGKALGIYLEAMT